MHVSLDSTAKAAEIVGAIAVIVGLFFVGLEIRSNTVAQQFSATQVLVSEYNQAAAAIRDPEFICTYIEASNDFNGLSQKDKIQYSLVMQAIWRTFEQLHYSASQGTIDENVHAGFRRQFAAIMQLPGNQQYWVARRDWFGDAFQAHVDQVISASTPIEPANFETEDCQ